MSTHTSSARSPGRPGRGRRAAALAAAALASPVPGAYAAGADTLKIGLVGCGGRGTGAARQCVESSPGVVLWALGDLFRDRLDKCRTTLKALGEKGQATDERCFTGFDNCLKVIQSGVDLVLLCEPPGFRPQHLKAAIEAGKHVFAEKPIAVDAAGVRSVLQTADLATQKKLAIVAGTQNRHSKGHLETMKRIHDGAIGPIVSAQCYFLTGELWYHERKPEWSDMEWQCRNWLYFTWLSGDHLVEQHIHNLDVVNWALGATPVKCLAVGGRQTRTDPKFGHIFDHFGVEYEYPGGVRVMSICRQANGTAHRVGENIVGALGTADPKGEITGKNAWKFEGETPHPQVQEHADLIASIRKGEPLNEGRRIAESTLTAVMGRLAAYSGRELSWTWALNACKEDLLPAKIEFAPLAVAPVAAPGKTPLGAPGEEPPAPAKKADKKAADKAK